MKKTVYAGIMKRITTLVLLVSLMLTVFQSPLYFRAQTENVDGLSMYIKDASDLAALSANPGANAVLQNDIEISSSEWTPIGSENSPFYGTFDGNGYTITYNFSFDGKSDSAIGLFGVVTGSVKRLIVAGTLSADIGNGDVGAVTARLEDGGKLFNCYSLTDIVLKGGMGCFVGGLVGSVASSEELCTVVRCVNYGSITASCESGRAGGVVGRVIDVAHIIKCSNTADINAGEGLYAAGILGEGEAVDILECSNKGAVNGRADIAAGITAAINNGSVEYCYNTGDITEAGECLGIFGQAKGEGAGARALTVRYCYNGGNAVDAGIGRSELSTNTLAHNYIRTGEVPYTGGDRLPTNAESAGYDDYKDLTEALLNSSGEAKSFCAAEDEGAVMPPRLTWEAVNVLPATAKPTVYTAYMKHEDSFDMRFYIYVPRERRGAQLKLVFNLSNGHTKTAKGKLGEAVSSTDRIYFDNVGYKAASGYFIYSLVLSGIEYNEWTAVSIEISSMSGVHYSAVLEYDRLFA